MIFFWFAGFCFLSGFNATKKLEKPMRKPEDYFTIILILVFPSLSSSVRI